METVLTNAIGKTRRTIEGGREYIVAPTTLIVPGVLPGSKGSLFYPDEECAANAGDWNETPIVVYHPQALGMNVSAKHPGIQERQGVGFLRNVSHRGKLRGEAWFDVERTRKVDDRVYHALLKGQPMEVSTGLYTTNEPAPAGANHNGRSYDYIARNYRPDHLAILPDQKGACSIEDGCGLLINLTTTNAAVGQGKHQETGQFLPAGGKGTQKQTHSAATKGHSTGNPAIVVKRVPSDEMVEAGEEDDHQIDDAPGSVDNYNPEGCNQHKPCGSGSKEEAQNSSDAAGKASQKLKTGTGVWAATKATKAAQAHSDNARKLAAAGDHSGAASAHASAKQEHLKAAKALNAAGKKTLAAAHKSAADSHSRATTHHDEMGYTASHFNINQVTSNEATRVINAGYGSMLGEDLTINPAVSEAQRKYLNAEFGHEWVKEHGFDNHGQLPEYKSDDDQEAEEGEEDAQTDNSNREVTTMDRRTAIARLTANCKCGQKDVAALNAMSDQTLEYLLNTSGVSGKGSQSVQVGGEEDDEYDAENDASSDYAMGQTRPNTRVAATASGITTRATGAGEGGGSSAGLGVGGVGVGAGGGTKNAGPYMKITPAKPGKKPDSKGTSVPEPKVDPEQFGATGGGESTSGTSPAVNEYLRSLPPELREVMQYGATAMRRDRGVVVNKLQQVAASTQNEGKKQLIERKLRQGLTINQLSELLVLVAEPVSNWRAADAAPSYFGQAGAFDNGSVENREIGEDDVLPLPTINWKQEQKDRATA